MLGLVHSMLVCFASSCCCLTHASALCIHNDITLQGKITQRACDMLRIAFEYMPNAVCFYLFQVQ